MRLSVYTYNGTEINDGSNYEAWFPRGSVMLQADGTPVFVERTHYAPVYTYKGRSVRKLPIHIKLKGTTTSQVDTIKKLFSTFDDSGLKTLIVKDLDNSSKQWQVSCTPVSMPDMDGQVVTINLAVPDPIWRAVSQTTDNWSITASGQTHAITPGGNFDTNPTYEITPTSAKGGGFNYRIWSRVYSQSTVAFPNYPLEITEGWDTSAIISDASRSVVINDGDGIAVDDVVITWDGETGTFPTAGIATIEDEQISYTAKTATQLTGVTRGVNGTTAATHADDVVIYASKMNADGSDLRVYVDGTEVDRWLDGIDTATTKVWINISLSPKREMTLRTAISDSGTPTYIDFAKTAANLVALKAITLPYTLLIDDERFTFTTKDLAGYRVTGIVRATNGTSAAAHTVGDTARWLEKDVWLYYGDNTLSAPSVDDTKKPVLNLATSTNTSWVYSVFKSYDNLRTGAWKSAILAKAIGSSVTNWYSANQNTDADPATEMGLKIGAFQKAGKWTADTASLYWSLYHPAGFTDIPTNTGEKYRVGTSWPVNVRLQKSVNGTTWVNVWAEATPASASSWTAWTHNTQSLSGTYKYLRYWLQGTVAATTDGIACFEVGAFTGTIPSASVPDVLLGSEQSGYYLDCTVTNSATSEYFTVKFFMELNQTLQINTDDHTVTYLKDNSAHLEVLAFSSVRFDYLKLVAGSTNTLTFDDTGTAGVTFSTKYYDRNS